jgi:putative cell wall-binding protein
MRRRPALLPALLLAAVVALSACGRKDQGTDSASRPAPGTSANQPGPGFAAFATKNTTRIAGKDPISNAAATAQAVFPSGTDGDHPQAVVLTDAGDWHTALAASVLTAQPLSAPILFSQDNKLPDASKKALASLAPTGAKSIGDAQIIRVGPTVDVKGYKSVDVAGADEFERAKGIDALLDAAGKARPGSVIVTGDSDPAAAMPAASLAAKTGAAILFSEKDSVPAPTREAIAGHSKPQIVVVGNKNTVGPKALAQLAKLGTVVVTGTSTDPAKASIQVARFSSGGFGWGIVDPGHGLVFARTSNPLSAVAAAPLSASGTFGPLLLLPSNDKLPSATKAYLRQIQPGQTGDPTRGVYNHGWIIGDENAIAVSIQSEIDSLLEIERVQN